MGITCGSRSDNTHLARSPENGEMIFASFFRPTIFVPLSSSTPIPSLYFFFYIIFYHPNNEHIPLTFVWCTTHGTAHPSNILSLSPFRHTPGEFPLQISPSRIPVPCIDILYMYTECARNIHTII